MKHPHSGIKGRLGGSQLPLATLGCCRQLRSPGACTVYAGSWEGAAAPQPPALLSLLGDLGQRRGRRLPGVAAVLGSRQGCQLLEENAV